MNIVTDILPVAEENSWIAYNNDYALWKWDLASLTPTAVSLKIGHAFGAPALRLAAVSDTSFSTSGGMYHADFWDMATLTPTLTFNVQKKKTLVSHVTPSQDRSLILSSFGHKIGLWDGQSLKRKKVLTLRSSTFDVNQCALSPDQTRIIVATWGGLDSWNTTTFEPDFIYRRLGGSALCFAFSTAVDTLLTTSFSRGQGTNILFVDQHTGAIQHQMQLDGDDFPTVIKSFEDHGDFILGTNAGEVVRISQTRQEITARWQAHASRIRSLAIVNDFLITCSDDETQKIWDVKTNALTAILCNETDGYVVQVEGKPSHREKVDQAIVRDFTTDR